ncbi:DNA mismatch repair endonuclease MutL [Flavobacteriaceae bacterium]|nr:DNA mismatch repair endonuclease MutL [Flavobacteriaceae bacterium]
MADIIKLLPSHVANQIAAGEVVQRPASVVKELLENSIDAGASKVELRIKDAGRTLIQILDNGKGMSPTDAKQAFARHATSKINKAEDLFDLNTKGFRGEALASIAAVAQVEMQTKLHEAELGTKIQIAGSSEIDDQEQVLCGNGTQIAVKNLFFNIPARRNFLKSNQVEFRHINDDFTRVALAHPKINFSLFHNDSPIFQLASSNLRQRIVAILGSKIDENLVPIKENTDVVSVNGFVTKAEQSKKRRGEQFFFVNGRFIKSSYLNHAIASAYEGLLQNGQHPSYFLFLEIPPSQIDINIHPTKTEIKFENEQVVYAILKAAVKHSLGQFAVSPSLDFDRDASLDVDYQTATTPSKNYTTPKIEVNPDFNPFKTTYTPTPKKEAKWESLYTEIKIEPEQSSVQEFNFEESPQSVQSMQVKNKYILATIKSGAVLINQNLAHQRILYEAFLMSMTINELPSQQLLFPVTLSFSNQEFQDLKQMRPDLETAGFVFQVFEKEGIEVSGIPNHISESQIAIVLEQLLDDLKLHGVQENFGTFDLMAQSFAKSMAIKSGVRLMTEEITNLVDQLFACKEASLAPNGKKTYVVLDTGLLEKLLN